MKDVGGGRQQRHRPAAIRVADCYFWGCGTHLQDNRATSYTDRRTGENGAPFAMDFVDEWHNEPLLAKAFAEKLRAGWAKANAENGAVWDESRLI